MRAFLRQVSEKAKPKTIKRKMATLKAFFNFLEFEDHIMVSPFRKMRINIAQEFRLPVVLTLAEVKKLLAHLYEQKHLAAKGSDFQRRMLIRDIAIIELLFGTGIRVSELCNLTRDSINLESGMVKIWGKGRKERLIPICCDQITLALQEYFGEFEPPESNGNFVFQNRTDEPISDQTIRLLVSKHVRDAKIDKKVTPHTFRHTFATLLLDNGLDIRNIQSLLGHSTIMTTQIYTQVSWERQRQNLTIKHPRTKIIT